MSNKENITKLQSALGRLKTKESTVYFLTYDTKNNARASVKHIYDLALTLHNNGITSKILVEDKNYEGVDAWLGEKYNVLPVVTIKDDKVELNIDDTLVVPEYYSNSLEQLSNVRCVKVMLVQQKDYIFETLPIGSRWIDYGFDRVITTNELTKKYILEYFPESLVYIIPPIIEDIFSPSEKPTKPYVAISCRDRAVHRKIISEFYLKYPQLRWITFRDMVQMSQETFAKNLKECAVSVWVDNESTFGTFPLESLKCGVPVIGKIPETEPEWLNENGMWTYDGNKIVDLLGTYMLAWIEGVELEDEVKQKMKDTLLPYEKTITEGIINSVFESLNNKRGESIEVAIKKLTEEETKEETTV
jgi:glycosyltransferase involved in cell wall biosynthesis